ncbi:MAG: type II toxin-antitoxin system HicA family toxin [Legionellaceae bacterium]|nr:type II toxin-antitoxin system HicA family toxin [Legionellaceae bacterium]
MNKKHSSTLTAIFANPVSTTLEWRKIESLLQSIGADVIEGSGSRVRFASNGVIATFHRPHPQKEAKPYQVRDARAFLEKLGVLP